jgi:hypothetical protein
MVLTLPSGADRAVRGDGVWSQTPTKPASEVAFVPNREGVEAVEAPLGTFVHARSGDKAGDANLGLWVVNDGSALRDQRISWLLATVTPDFVRELLPETRDLEIDVHALPNLGGVNVVVHGLLGRGVAASTRFDPQAKALGEWARSRHVEIPEVLL